MIKNDLVTAIAEEHALSRYLSAQIVQTILDKLVVARDPVARNRGADFVEHLVPSHYVRRNKVLDLTPRRR